MAAGVIAADAETQRQGQRYLPALIHVERVLVGENLTLGTGSEGGSRPRLCENSRVQFARRKFFSIW
jgi:hypothetical protein